MKKIMMIVQNDFINDSRIIKEASALGKNGYEVKVFALYNNGLKECEEFKYFSVKRIKLSTRDKLSKRKISQVVKFLEFQNKCVKEACEFLPDVIHCHDVYTLPIGEKIIKKIKNKKDIKFIYDSHELWSNASNNLSMPRILLNIQNKLEAKIIKKCDKVITVSNSIVKYLEKEYALKETPILLRNIPYKYSDIKNTKKFHEELNIPKDKKIVLYQGAVNIGRGIENLIEAMTYLDKNIVAVILGNGAMVDKYKKMVKDKNLQQKVFFHPAVDSQVLIQYTSSADLGVSMINNICLSYYYSLPNKMFEYIQSEIPVICSNYPDMKEIVYKYKVGSTSDPNNAKEISEAISKVLGNEHVCKEYKNNCKIAKEELNWEKESKKLIKLYEDITKK